jgi:glutamine synthetase adenylyltransferase
MRAGIWNPQTRGTLRELTANGLLRKDEAALVEKSYEYLRLIESALRRWENKSVSSLPADETEQRKLAQRAGADSLDSFARRYQEARESIHAVYSHYLHSSAR